MAGSKKGSWSPGSTWRGAKRYAKSGRGSRSQTSSKPKARRQTQPRERTLGSRSSSTTSRDEASLRQEVTRQVLNKLGLAGLTHDPSTADQLSADINRVVEREVARRRGRDS